MSRPSSKEEQPTFERWANGGAARAGQTYTQRGQQYADSWSAALQEAPFETTGSFLSSDPRVARLGTLCDVKLSRIRSLTRTDINGCPDYDVLKDNLIDLIAYLQAMLGGITESGG